MTTQPPKRLANRLHHCLENIWLDFTRCKTKYSEIDVGVGLPDYPPSEHIQRALADVAMEGNTYLQYTRDQGHPRLVKAIAALHGPLLGRDIDPMSEIIVTHGAYESLVTAFLSLVNPGDEVILIEPFFDAYKSMTKLAEGTPVYVPLRPSVESPTSSADWVLDPQELENKFSANTKLLMLNNPNNPIGKVFKREELEMLATLCIKHDVICISDEVYEWLVYPGAEHVRIATLPGMWERTITISSASKSFSVTGWRVGWSIGPKELIDCQMISHQNGDATCATPVQEAIARCMEIELAKINQPCCHFTQQRTALLSKRNLLIEMARNAGFKVCVPEAGYFLLVDWTAFATREMIDDGTNIASDFQFAIWLLKNHKIATIPPSAFCEESKDTMSNYVRLCYFKTDELLNKIETYFASLNPLKDC
ncbi:kynurenine--oxoglutarate transaminase 3-like [Watersipora subatra]|uniref:kynurenine--oxoglutarate transaminase 3-like n=1 Tax=Watersipora subatra TaxID=2589382 RepID=UPI00355AE6FE